MYWIIMVYEFSKHSFYKFCHMNALKISFYITKWHFLLFGIDYAKVGSRKMMFNFKTI
jgi:hypothetical protein